MPRRDLLCYPFCYPRRLRSATRMWCRTAVAFPSFRSAIRRCAAASVASSIGGPFWRAGFLLVRGGRPSCASTLATGRSRSRDAAACARIARISSCTCGRTDGARSRSSTSNDPPGDPPPALPGAARTGCGVSAGWVYRAWPRDELREPAGAHTYLCRDLRQGAGVHVRRHRVPDYLEAPFTWEIYHERTAARRAAGCAYPSVSASLRLVRGSVEAPEGHQQIRELVPTRSAYPRCAGIHHTPGRIQYAGSVSSPRCIVAYTPSSSQATLQGQEHARVPV
jgi:hypothetical protein